MAEINLRSYAENDGQVDAAIAHCRHILQQHPKDIDIYRLLGKTYLEGKRYGDSADIFQRVLSAIPDDFVSHIGMSIIREDEGNVDSAIWHMTRAFEANPANAAIQQEVRRLIGKRDGLEPQKVHLTRGALARIYAHGELYPQAIGELQTALKEDTERPDLQVLLADLYWRTNQRKDAAGICSQILEKLPYCRIANCITATLLQESGQIDNASIYLRRLTSLDPYFAFLKSPMEDPKTVDQDSVQVERLDWKAGQPLPTYESQQPEWVATLGSDLGPKIIGPDSDENAPGWLQSMKTVKNSSPEPVIEEDENPSVHPFAGAKPPEEAEIPTWMRDAGWSESTGETVESPITFTDKELKTLESGQIPSNNELAPAEIPDWLQEITPPESTEKPGGMEEPASKPSAEETEIPDWLNEANRESQTPSAPAAESAEETLAQKPSPGERLTPVAPQTTEKGAESIREEQPSDIPVWLEDAEPGATKTIVTWLGTKANKEPASKNKKLPDWMDGTGPINKKATPPLEAESIDQITNPQIPFPDELPKQEPVQTPDQPLIAGEEKTTSASSKAEPEIKETVEEAPDWLHMITEPEQEPPFAQITGENETPEWLQSMAEQSAKVKNVTPSTPEDLPNWLQATSSAPEEESAKEEGLPEWLHTGSEEVLESAPKSAEIPDWLANIAEESSKEPPAAEEIPELFPEMSEQPSEEEEPLPKQETDDSSLEWLRDLTEESPSEEQIPESVLGRLEQITEKPSIAEPEPIPNELDWLKDLAGEAHIPEQLEEEAPDWVEAITKKEPQPAPPESMTVKEAPEWIEAIAEEEPQPTPPESMTVKEAPERIEVVAKEEPQPIPPKSITVKEAPDWLVALTAEKKFLSEQPPSEDESAERVPVEPEPAKEKLPSEVTEERAETIEGPSLQDVGPHEEVEQITKPVIELPSRPQELKPEKPPDAISVDEAELPLAEQSDPSEMEIEGALDWLEKSAKEVLPEPEIPTVRIVQEKEIPPEEAPPEKESAIEPAAEEKEVYEFLEELAAEEAIPPTEEPPEAAAPVQETPTAPPAQEAPEAAAPVQETPTAPPAQEAPDQVVAEKPSAVVGPEIKSSISVDRILPEQPEAGMAYLDKLASVQKEPEKSAPAVEEQVEEFQAETMVESEISLPESAEESEAPTKEPAIAPQEHISPEPPAAEQPAATPPKEEQKTATIAPEAIKVEPIPATPEPEIAETASAQAVPPEEEPGAESIPHPEQEMASIDQVETLAKQSPPESEQMHPIEAIEPSTPEIDDTGVPEWLRQAAKLEEETPAEETHPPVSEPATATTAESEHLLDEPEIESKPLKELVPEQAPAITEQSDSLSQARQFLISGNIEEAIHQYNELIKKHHDYDQVIGDLKNALKRDPDSPLLWQALGDVYMQNDQLTDAVEAYQRGLEAT
jgi:tetratricopeptide (TPR) repeat protein